MVGWALFCLDYTNPQRNVNDTTCVSSEFGTVPKTETAVEEG